MLDTANMRLSAKSKNRSTARQLNTVVQTQEMRIMQHNFWRTPVLTLAVLALTITTASAQYTATTLYNFGSVPNDAVDPGTGLIFDAAGNLYGATNLGGTGAGTVYELSPNGSGGWTESILFTFTINTGAPARPNGSLIFDAAGNLYGVSQNGGPDNNGSVYELSPNSSGGWTLTDLYDFAGGTDGQEPLGSLTWDSAKNLFGTTFEGGGSTNDNCFEGCGTVFELSPNGSGGWTEKVIYAFTGGADGAGPGGGLLITSSGSILGAAASGGSYTNCFAGCGTIFRLIPTSGSYHFGVLHTFQGPDGGSYPVAIVFDAAGNIYGAAAGGGHGCGGALGCGVIFKLAKPVSTGAWTESILHPFTGKHDGSEPAGLIFDSSGNLFGTASAGASHNSGTAWELSPSGTGWTFNEIYTFGSGTSGDQPGAGLILDSSGNLYGTAQGGGTHEYGTAFELSPPAAER
jgi:hypothetical protein